MASISPKISYYTLKNFIKSIISKELVYLSIFNIFISIKLIFLDNFHADLKIYE